MHDQIAIVANTVDKIQEAKNLAQQYGINYIQPSETKLYPYLLVIDKNYIGLQDTRDKKFLPFRIDFYSKQFLYRIKHATLKSEVIGKAMGIRPRDNPYILDATAGLGRDSVILAALGYHVTMLELSPIIYLLLHDALKRGMLHDELKQILNRLSLINIDAKEWMKNLECSQSNAPDIIYLDPMFPKREKSASVKKEMVILQNLLTNDGNFQDLLSLALTCAKHRVVVKRPRLAAKIMDFAPSFSLTGKSSRFDIYLV